MKTKHLLETVCGCAVRYCHKQDGTWSIWPRNDEIARSVCLKLLESGRIVDAFERWTKLPILGLVQFVQTLRLRRTSINILHPAIKPEGQFSR